MLVWIDRVGIDYLPVLIVIAKSEWAVDDVADTLHFHNLSQRLAVGGDSDEIIARIDGITGAAASTKSASTAATLSGAKSRRFGGPKIYFAARDRTSSRRGVRRRGIRHRHRRRQ